LLILRSRDKGLGARPIQLKGKIMHCVVRAYGGKGAKELFDVLEEHKGEVEEMLSKVKGLVSYTLVRNPDGGYSMTVCEDKAGVEESAKVAREWIAKNASGTGASPPQTYEGTVIVHI